VIRLDAAVALESIVRPKSVVVIGANEAEGKLTSGSVRNILRHGYEGTLYVVNPNRPSVYGVATHRAVADLPEVPDTAVIVLSAGKVGVALEECAAKGIQTATVVASGFGEGGGSEGANAKRALEDLNRVIAQTGMRVLGPNTAGLLNISDSYVPRASENHPPTLLSGRIGVVTQSGGLCNTLVNRAVANGVGVGLAISTGNQIDLDLWDVGEYLLEQSDIDVILTIVEGFSDTRKFLDFTDRARGLGKPIIALKLGVSEAGRRAVETHSGSLAGSAAVQRAALRDLHVVQVAGLDELWEVASLFTCWGFPTDRTRRLGVITPSGGDGAIIADEASRLGLTIPQPTERTSAALGALVPGLRAENPFDTQAALAVSGPQTLVEQIAVVAADSGFDALLLALPVLATPGAVAALGPLMEGIGPARRKKVAVSLWTAGNATDAAVATLRRQSWPIFEGSIRAARAISYYDSFAEVVDRVPALSSVSLEPVAPRDPGAFRLATYWAARRILGSLGVPFNEARLVLDVDAALDGARQLGYPVTLKLSTDSFTHKAEAGAVVPFLRDEASVRSTAERLLAMNPRFGEDEGLIVEEYVHSVLPVFIGGHRDPEFGSFVLVGLGGSFAEAYNDIARIPCPANDAQIIAALEATRCAALLRKQPPAYDRVVRLVAQMSERMNRDRTLFSFDVNPILVRADSSIVAVDARVELLSS
jgi:acetate---CoA ligase (ADP-forming)